MHSKVKLIIISGLSAAALVLLPLSAWAYDGTMSGGYIGGISAADFKTDASNYFTVRSVIVCALGGGSINSLENVTNKNADSVDIQALNDHQAWLKANMAVSDSDCYCFICFRDKSATKIDGWVIFSRYSKSTGWTHYMYAFSWGM